MRVGCAALALRGKAPYHQRRSASCACRRAVDRRTAIRCSWLVVVNAVEPREIHRWIASAARRIALDLIADRSGTCVRRPQAGPGAPCGNWAHSSSCGSRFGGAVLGFSGDSDDVQSRALQILKSFATPLVRPDEPASQRFEPPSASRSRSMRGRASGMMPRLR